MEKFKKTLLIDLDGVLNKYDGKYNPDYIPEIREGASDFVKKLSSEYKLKLFTTRDGIQAKNWLCKNNLTEYFAGVTNIKEPAYLLIDDRCIRFDGDYTSTLQEIRRFKPWFKSL